jgi:acyl carrier protein
MLTSTISGTPFSIVQSQVISWMIDEATLMGIMNLSWNLSIERRNGMLTRLLLLQPKEETTEAEIRAVIGQIDDLEVVLGERLEAQVVTNMSASPQGYTYALALCCPDQVWQRISTHPDFQRISTYLKLHCTHMLAFDANLDDWRRRRKPLRERYSPAEWQKKTVSDRLTVLLMDALEVSAHEIIPTASLVEDLGADSLNLVEIMFAIQEEFQVEMTGTDVEKLTTVGEIGDFLTSKEKHR